VTGDLETVTLRALDWAVTWLRVEHGDHGPGPGCWKCAGLYEQLDDVQAALEEAADNVFAAAELEAAA